MLFLSVLGRGKEVPIRSWADENPACVRGGGVEVEIVRAMPSWVGQWFAAIRGHGWRCFKVGGYVEISRNLLYLFVHS